MPRNAVMKQKIMLTTSAWPVGVGRGPSNLETMYFDRWF